MAIKPLHLTIPPQENRSIIERPGACGGLAGERQGVSQTIAPMFSLLRLMFDAKARAASRRAKQHLAATMPSSAITDLRLRATEPKRWVFAVFYEIPGVKTSPGVYKLVAVARGTEATTVLETTPDSPYWIRGLK